MLRIDRVSTSHAIRDCIRVNGEGRGAVRAEGVVGEDVFAIPLAPVFDVVDGPVFAKLAVRGLEGDLYVKLIRLAVKGPPCLGCLCGLRVWH